MLFCLRYSRFTHALIILLMFPYSVRCNENSRRHSNIHTHIFDFSHKRQHEWHETRPKQQQQNQPGKFSCCKVYAHAIMETMKWNNRMKRILYKVFILYQLFRFIRRTLCFFCSLSVLCCRSIIPKNVSRSSNRKSESFEMEHFLAAFDIIWTEI